LNRVSVEKAIQNFRADFVKRNIQAGASGEVSRAAYRFALIGFAGEFATDAGITGWKEGEATRAAECCFANWMARRVGGSGASDAEAAIRQVRNFIEVNGASRFQLAKARRSGDEFPKKVINRAGFRVDGGNGDALEYLIFLEVFREEVCQGFDHRMVAKALLTQGYLDSQPPHHTKKTSMPEVGNIRFYAIRASILNG
jgi:putative DNA primase/helicase